MLPNGPTAPFWLQQFRWIMWPLETLDGRARRYGDSFRIGNLEPPMVYFCSPEALQTIFTASSEQLSSGLKNQILLPILGEHSLILLDGTAHQQQRRLLMPPFHGERMRAYGQLIQDITAQVMKHQSSGSPFAVRPAMQEISMRVILSAVFGLHRGERHEKLRQLLSVQLDSVGTLLSSLFLFYRFLQQDWGAWSPWGRFLRRRQQIDALLFAEIEARRAEGNGEQQDILTLLLSARDEAGQPMTDAELRDELLTLLFAGHETTASALAWALYWIGYLPEVYRELRQELDGLGPEPQIETIGKLPYLNAVCQETLRLYPIAINAFPRIVKQPIKIQGYELPIGTTIIPAIYLAHQREAVYPEPKRFRPERFLERQFSPYEYLPFGGGDRRCIGMAFALYEMKLVLATLLLQFDLKLEQPRPLKPVRRGLTLAPPPTLRMVAQRRTTKPLSLAQRTRKTV